MYIEDRLFGCEKFSIDSEWCWEPVYEELRIIRGGSWEHTFQAPPGYIENLCSVANAGNAFPSARFNDIGFRLARNAT